MFVGTFEHSLDEKGRVVLPSPFRSYLADKGFLGQLDACLGLWTEEEFAKVAERLEEKIREGAVTQEARRAFASSAHEVRPDSQGRITIPQRLRAFAGLDQQVVLIGAIHRIEIFDAARWAARSTEADDTLIRAVTEHGL